MPHWSRILAVLLAVSALGGLCWKGWGNDRDQAGAIAASSPKAEGLEISTRSRTPEMPAPSQPTPGQGIVAPGGKFEPGQDRLPKQGMPDAEAMKAAAKDYIKEVGADEMRVGEVRLLKKQRTLIFTATVAVRNQPLEYALVHEKGKAHEALLVTKVPVQDVHVAALLMDASGRAPKIDVSWRKNGGETRMPLSDLIRVREIAPDTLAVNPWIYNGSEFHQGGFAAMSEGSIIALVNDPAALVNHPASAALQRDDVFFANSEKLPADGVPVSVILIFPASR